MGARNLRRPAHFERSKLVAFSVSGKSKIRVVKGIVAIDRVLGPTNVVQAIDHNKVMWCFTCIVRGAEMNKLVVSIDIIRPHGVALAFALGLTQLLTKVGDERISWLQLRGRPFTAVSTGYWRKIYRTV